RADGARGGAARVRCEQSRSVLQDGPGTEERSVLAVTGTGLPALLLFLAFPLAASEGSPPLALTVTPSRIEFTRDDAPSALKLTLELAASAVTPVTVSTYGGGSIHVRRLTRNGVRVKPWRMTGVSFFEDPCVGNAASAPLLPGAGSRWPRSRGPLRSRAARSPAASPAGCACSSARSPCPPLSYNV